MGIHFEKQKYSMLAERYEDWWQRRSQTPIVKVQVRDAYDPGRPQPDVPLLSQANCHLFSYTAEQIIDRIDYELSKCAFLGDAFPMVNLWAFGPSALAGFCGAELVNDTGNVWYRIPSRELEEIHIQYDPDSIWVKRIKELYRVGLERWDGQVVMSMPDLGGFQDVIANFAGTQELLMSCAAARDDDEEEDAQLRRLQGEVYHAWMEAYKDLEKVLSSYGNPGYTDWGGILSSTPSYILQDDFAYMIGPDLFRAYGYPEIRQACMDLDHTIYHLDGPGNLNHLPLLLEDQNLDAVQWVYGEGQPGARHWMDVYDKIYEAGKAIECIGDREDFIALRSRYGGRVFYQCTVDSKDNFAMQLEPVKDCIHSYRIFQAGELKEAKELTKCADK